MDVTRASRLALNGLGHEARCDAVLDADRFGQVSVLLDYCRNPRTIESPYLNNDVLSAISLASHTFKAYIM